MAKKKKRTVKRSIQKKNIISKRPRRNLIGRMIINLVLIAMFIYGIIHTISDIYEGLSIITGVAFIWLIFQLIIELRKK